MPNVLQELQLPVCTLAEYWGAEWLHDLLDSHASAGQLVLCGADQSEGSHTHGLQVYISGGDLKNGTEDGEANEIGHGSVLLRLGGRKAEGVKGTMKKLCTERTSSDVEDAVC